MSARILIIEDDADFAQAVRVMLEAHGHDVELAESPDAGLPKAREYRPDLIILDVMFGKEGRTGGFDCALSIRKDERLAPIPVLMVTAVNRYFHGFRYSDETDGEYLPVDGFIDKPVLPLDLIEKVNALLARKTSRWRNWPEVEGVG